MILQGSCRCDCVHINALRNGSVISCGFLPWGNGHRWPLFSLFAVLGCSAPKIKPADVISAFSSAWDLTAVT